MMMDIVNVRPVGHCDRNASNEQKALYAEILTLREQLANGKRLLSEQMELTNERTKLCIELRAKVASADVLAEALREITYSHDGYARKKAEQALSTYDKLSEVKHDTK